jgi:tripeptide aminopeptidase
MEEPRFPTSCIDRFLRYVTFDTQSEEGSASYPSTEKQWDLLRLLAEELRQLGLDDVALDDHGYVFATVPATTAKQGVPTLGFLAHVDTSPETSGRDVRPILHRGYEGQDLVLPDDPNAVLRLADSPELAAEIGRDIITASGKTLLGADDKAGVAEIMAAAEYLMAHPEIAHGKIRLAFTPDEEIGRGTEFFDVERFAAAYAYTLDGGAAGELQTETFSADSFTVTFRGINTHPGYAKGTMVNSIKVAADFLHRLPKDDLSPETTEDYQGYVHPNVVEAGVERTRIRFLIRDFSTPALAKKESWLEELARVTVADWPGSTVDFEVRPSYRNMREILDRHPEVVERAREAILRAGLELRESPIRGGTDGARLSFEGLPTPNLFAGQHNIHSHLEWASVWEMHKAVEVIIELVKLWEERSGA